MKRLSVSLLAASLAFAGNAAAQSSGYYSGQQGGYHDSAQDRNATYDYARVIRVDPVIESGYRGQSTQASQRCYYRQADDVYVGNGGYNGSDDYYRNGSNNGYYGNDGYSNRNANGSQTGRTMATVIGGIAGAVLGSQIGDGSGQYVGTAVGSMVGGMAGRSIYDTSQRNRQLEKRGTVRVCDPVPVTSRNGGYSSGGYNDGYYDGNENLAGYDVTYEYANRTYRTRTDYHPGDRIRVRVDVRPE